MERTIMIANNKTQKRYTIQTSATTLGELQDQMDAQGIDYSGMTFTEGITKTQLLTRDSMLPTNVAYKGRVTNDLVVLLTNPNKQIASGAGNDRKIAYSLIKEYHLEAAIQEGEGQNYTRVKTDTLWDYIEIARGNAPADNQQLEETRNELSSLNKEQEDSVNDGSATMSPLPDVKEATHASTVSWFYEGVKAMVTDNLLYTDDVIVLTSLLNELAHRLIETEPKITDSDIDRMLDSI